MNKSKLLFLFYRPSSFLAINLFNFVLNFDSQNTLFFESCDISPFFPENFFPPIHKGNFRNFH